MNNVVQFKPKPRPVDIPQQSAAQVEKPKEELTGQDVMIGILKALAFYANQGWDGGSKARQALMTMESAAKVAEEVPPSVA